MVMSYPDSCSSFFQGGCSTLEDGIIVVGVIIDIGGGLGGPGGGFGGPGGGFFSLSSSSGLPLLLLSLKPPPGPPKPAPGPQKPPAGPPPPRQLRPPNSYSG